MSELEGSVAMNFLNMRTKMIFRCYSPVFIYIGMQVIIMFIFFLGDFLSSEYNISLISLSANKQNFYTILFSGIGCIFIFTKQLREKYNMRITDGLSNLKIKIICKLFLWVIILKLIVIVPLVIIYFIDKNCGNSFELVKSEILSINVVLVVISGCFIIPITEELLFRGLLLHNLSQIMSDRKSNIVQALIFAIIHMNYVQSITALFFGYF